MKTQRKNKLFVLFGFVVLGMLLVLGLLFFTPINTKIVHAASAGYTMQFDWSYTYTDYKNPSSSRSSSGQSVTEYAWTLGQNRTFTMSIYCDSTTGSNPFTKGTYIKSNSVTIYASNTNDGGTYVPNISIKDSGNNIIASGNGSATATCNDGSYTVTATWGQTINNQYANNRHFYTATLSFNVDTTPPSITLPCGDYGFTNNSVTVSYADAKTSSSGYYGLSTGSGFSSVSTAFSSSKTFSGEGNYTINAIDSFGNSAQKHFTIDKTAPSLSLKNIVYNDVAKGYVAAEWDKTIGGVGAQRCNDKDVLTVKYSHSTTSYPTSAATSYTEGTHLSSEGYYYFEISDSSGNKKSYRAQVDNTAPTVTSVPAEFNNGIIRFAATDWHGVKIEYTKDNISQGVFEVSSLNLYDDGEYKFRAWDYVGNVTEWYTAKIYRRSTFGNFERIQNSYTLPTWYSVNLPQRVYGSVSGIYSFESRDAALDFAIKKEWEYRVVEFADGSFSYVNISNESVTQRYTERAVLDTAVMKYASSYISERNILRENGLLPTNPTDANGVSRPDALVGPNIEIPVELTTGIYAGIPKMLISRDFSFRNAEEGVSGNECTLFFQYVHDGVSLSSLVGTNIRYGGSIADRLQSEYIMRQGWYLVRETDLCRNSEQYLVCFDTGIPKLRGTASGPTGISDILFDEYYTETYQSLLRYVSLQFGAPSDDIDDYAILHISGRDLNEYYIEGDEIPVLNYENGYYGDYTITVYDRSLNKLTFNVRIAGREPSLSYTSLNNDIKCTLTINLNDNSNVLTDIKLFKVTYEGNYNGKGEDDDGNTVEPYTLEYILRMGGKYVIEFTDIYGRTVTVGPLFYMKGLPVGTLNGVKENGLTNRDVTFTYDSDNSVILYAWIGGTWEEVDALSSIEDGERQCVSSIIAGIDTSYKFKYFLYKTDDMNLFTEYLFEIDKIPPTAVAKTKEEIEVTNGSVTAKDFYLTWSETGYTVYYYNQSTALGSIGAERYTRGTVLTKSGTWVFDFTDAAKNTMTFTVVLDKEVSWELSSPGYTQRNDGSYISKHHFILTVNERTSVWEVNSSNGLAPQNGQKFDTDGTYEFFIVDMYGNELSIVLIVDNLPPTATITASDGSAIAPNSKTNKAFVLCCEEEGVVILYSVGGRAYTAYSGEMIDEESVYSFKLTDAMSNSATVTVEIDRMVNFIVSGNVVVKEGNYFTRTSVIVTVNETYDLFVIVDAYGVEQDVNEKLNEEGEYRIHIVDVAQNEITFSVFVDRNAPSVTIITASGRTIEEGAVINEAFKVSCDEEGVVINYTQGAGSSSYYGGAFLEESAIYTFTVSDFLGNKSTFTVRINYDVAFTVNGMYVEDGNGSYVSRTWLSVTMNEESKQFVICTDNGRYYAENERLSGEGVYHVRIESAVGNTAAFDLVIDRTAPVIELDGATSGKSTKTDVTVRLTGYDQAYCQITGQSDRLQLTGETVFSSEAVYTVTAADIAGNVASVMFTIDKSVDITPSIVLISGQIISVPVSFAFGEEVTALLQTKAGEAKYTHGSISDIGDYMLTVTDELGNVAEFSFTIIERAARAYKFSFDENYEVNVLKDGSVALSAINGNIITLTESGNYELTFTQPSVTYTLQLTVDNLPPTLKITQEKKKVSFGNPSKDELTYTLYKNGQEVNFNVKDDITEVGTYRLVVTDKLGNVNEYTFTLRYINTAGVVLIFIFAICGFALALWLIISRFKQKIK